MPHQDDRTVADRSRGLLTNMHPRLDGDVILEPFDIMEGQGEFTQIDKQNEPVGWDLGQPEKPDGRHVYIGTTADNTSRQTHRSLLYSQPSHLVNYELVESQPPPNASTPLLARIPRPPKPILRAVTATVSGYPESTVNSPYWFAWAFIKNGKYTTLSPPVPFALANGQSFLAPLPADVPEGVNEVALFLSEPKKSTPGAPGRMRLQRVVDLRKYFSETYPMSGPYRYNGKLAPATNETALAAAKAASIARQIGPFGSRVGTYWARISWTDANGETIPGAYSRQVAMPLDEGYTIRDKDNNITFMAGRGKIAITRPTAPPGATGWKAYLYIQPGSRPDLSGYSAGWRRVYNRITQQGDATPFSLSTWTVSTAGWDGSEQYYAGNDIFVCQPVVLPAVNTSGIAPPENQPEAPESYGPPRPDADTYFVRITDTVRGVESLPSEAASINLGAEQLMSVVFAQPNNLIANGTFIETTPEELPYHWTVVTTGGTATMTAAGLRLATQAAQITTTPSATALPFSVNHSLPNWVAGSFTVEAPEAGAQAGSAEVILQETDSAGTTTTTVILTKSGLGTHDFDLKIAASTDTGAAVRWKATTVSATVTVRMTGSSKNMTIVVHALECRTSDISQRTHKPITTDILLDPEPEPLAAPSTTAAPPTIINPPEQPPEVASLVAVQAAEQPAYATAVTSPPEPSWTPDAIEIAVPDRPSSNGLLIEAQNFNSGLPTAAGWTLANNNGVTVAATSAASTEATGSGMQITKAVAGVAGNPVGYGYLHKLFAPDHATFTSRHSLGCYTRNRLSVAPASGHLTVHPLVRPSDGRHVAWFDISSNSEQSQLTIPNAPYDAGTLKIKLDQTVHNIAVNGVPRKANVTISAGNAAAPGSVEIVLDQKSYWIRTGGTTQAATLSINGLPTTPGYVSLKIGSQTRYIHVSRYTSTTVGKKVYNTPTTPALLAAKIAAAGWTGYRVTRSGQHLYFTADNPGPLAAPVFSAGTTRMPFKLTQTSAGTAETKEELAARIKEMIFPGWTVSVPVATTPNVLQFTANTSGARNLPTYYPHSTGATGSVASVQVGTLESKETVLARIATTAFPNHTVVRSGDAFTFTHINGGVRYASTYSPGTTGMTGTMLTTRQGSNADVIFYSRSKTGLINHKKIMTALGTTTIFNLDLQVSGAGTDQAVISAWGSTGNDPLKLLARFPFTQLAGVPVGRQYLGVTAESSAALTWTLHTDQVEISNRGKTYFREHNYAGKWLNQVEAYYDPTQPMRQDLLLRNYRVAVLPGRQYKLGAFMRINNPTSVPAQPLVVTARKAESTFTHNLGDITGSGITGKTPWTHYEKLITVPPDCYALEFNSRDIGPLEAVIQEIVLSPGATVNRTGLYNTTGEYSVTFDVRTPKAKAPFHFWNRKRSTWGASADQSRTGTTIQTFYRSAPPSATDPTLPGTWSGYSTDPTTVPDQPFLQTVFQATGNGATTPEINAGSPYVDYRLMASTTKNLSTLLKANRTELPGGAVFARLEGWSRRNTASRKRLPSGRLHDDPELFPSVGHLPECEVLVFTDEARRYIEENWRKPFVAEVYGAESLTLKISEQPEFERQTIAITRDNPQGERYAIWKAKLPPSEVIAAAPIK